MIPLINPLLKLYNFLSHHFNELSRPNAKYIQKNILLELVHKRNKAFVLVELLVICFFMINLLCRYGPPSAQIEASIASFGVTVIFFLTCRSHPETFRTVYNVINCLHGISLTQHGLDGVLGAWQATVVYPNLVYLFTGSLPQYLLSFVVQTFIMNTYLQDFMETSIREMDPKVFVRTFSYYTNQNMVFNMLTIILTHFMIENAYVRIADSEKKKENFERQKNFLLSFSHELRNLINSFMGNVKLATLESLSDKVKDLLLNAEVCSELLLHMVNNILDTGKVEIGDLEINPTPVRFYDAMERVWSVCSELIKRKNLRGKMRIQKTIPEVLMLDHYRLTQIFLNLIGNAVKFTDAGGIDVDVEWIPTPGSSGDMVEDKHFHPVPFNDQSDLDEGMFEKEQAFSVFDSNFLFLNFVSKKIDKNQLGLKPRSCKGILKIIVADTGVGMSQDDLGRLFQRFTQVTSDISKRKLGTGLGLFITKELVQRMGGEIKVFSKRGKGTAFIICLPVDPVVKDSTGNSFDLGTMKRRLGQKHLKALVADDQLYSQKILADFMKALNIDVVEIADNGLQAYHKFIEKALRDRLDIVTLDLDMPVMNGKVCAQRIRELEREKRLRPCLIFIISGNCTSSEIQECLDKNSLIRADAFLKKPVNIEELCQTILDLGEQSISRFSTNPFLTASR